MENRYRQSLQIAELKSRRNRINRWADMQIIGKMVVGTFLVQRAATATNKVIGDGGRRCIL